jgi:cysteine desulfurase
MHYLDHAATAPLRPAAQAAMAAAMAEPGNASSQHGPGRAARRIAEDARDAMAAALGAHPSEVLFTSGGTESDNLAVKGLFWARRAADPRRDRIVLSRIEHHAVLEAAQWLADHEGAQLDWLDVDRDGLIDPAQLGALLAAQGDRTALISAMWANNEVGTLQPIRELAAIAAQHGVPLHVDAVQAAGSEPIDFAASGVSALSVSAHKFGGPAGAGALLLRRDAAAIALAHGGGQERGLRSGTLAVPLIAGMAAALGDAVAGRGTEHARIDSLRAMLAAGAGELGGVQLNGHPTRRLAGIAHLSVSGCEGDALLMLLDQQGIACSTGSACDAGVSRASHVLLAMGRTEPQARAALRFSLGHTTTPADVAAVLDALPGVVASARAAAAPATLAGAAR